MKISFLITILLAQLFAGFSAEFEQFKKENQQEFAKFKAELDSDFRNYKKILSSEYKKFRQEIFKNWGDYKTSSAKVWVEYSPDKQIRKIVDFEKNEIKVELISKHANKKLAERILYKEAIKTIQESPKIAYDKSLDKKIDKKFQKVAKTDFVTKKINNSTPIISSMVFNKKPTTKQLVKFVSKHKATVQTRERNRAKIYSMKIKLPKYFPLKKAQRFQNDVRKYSQIYKVDKALVFAIIHSESSFNPLSTSHIPAYGLMQIVPRSAGIDAYYRVYKQKKLLSSSYLYVPRNNIELGSAYLSILGYQYLKGIRNPLSRMYCVIAAYNTGAGNVARAFVGKHVRKGRIRKAVKIINQMSPDEVYRHLINNLPYDETKRYLKKVSKRFYIYQKLNL